LDDRAIARIYESEISKNFSVIAKRIAAAAV
jgi:hypothetical protein